MPLPDALEIGKRIAAFREFGGWSQERLAKAAGLSQRTISEIEGGRPSATETIQRISQALGVPIGELLGEAPPRLRYSHRLSET